MAKHEDILTGATQVAGKAWQTADEAEEKILKEDAQWTRMAEVMLEDFKACGAYLVELLDGREPADEDDACAWEVLPMAAYRAELSEQFRLWAWKVILKDAPQPLRTCGFCHHHPSHEPLTPEIGGEFDKQLLVALRWLAQTRMLDEEELARSTHSAVAASAATRLDFCRVEVSVGVMILAAKIVDVPVVVCGFGSPNALLGVRWEDPMLPDAVPPFGQTR